MKEISIFSLSKTASSDEMLAKFSETLDYVKNFMLPIFDEVKTLDDAAYFLIRYSSSAFFFKKEAFDKGNYLDSNEILLLTAISDTKAFIESTQSI